MNNSLLCCALLALGVCPLAAQSTSPRVLTSPSPGYPEELTDSGLSGRAEVDVTVRADGTVADAQLAMATHRAFGRAAMAAVKKWTFETGQRDGSATEVRLSIPFQFVAPLQQQVNAVAKRKVFVPLTEPALTQKDYGAKLKVTQPARPIYPRSVAGGGRDVTVQVNFVVAPDGHTLNPAVTGNPPAEFVGPAMMAVAQMLYAPPVKNGIGVYVETSTKLEFSNERRGFGGEGGGGRGGGGRGGGRGERDF